MTDFVVSKVVMSVCALLVAGAMADILGATLSTDPAGDLEDLLAGLQRIVSSMEEHGGECELAWQVPLLTSGPAISVSFHAGLVTARAGLVTAVAETQPGLHAWAWDGQPLNTTMIEGMDRECAALVASSGEVLTIAASAVILDDCPTLLMFVR